MREELQPWMDILYRAPTKVMSLNARGERWRGTICEYDGGDDHPNNAIDHAHEGYPCADPALLAGCNVVDRIQPAQMSVMSEERER